MKKPPTTLFSPRLFATIFALIATALPVALSAAIPQRWTVETSRIQPARFEGYHGETIEFAATMQTYGKPLALPPTTNHEPPTTNHEISIYWQTNGMGSAYWTAPAEIRFEPSNPPTLQPSNLVFFARWTPEMDVGADVYNCFIGAPGENYRAAFQLRLRPSPGAVPSELPLPVKTLDFAQVTVLNAPYYSKSETDAALSDKQDVVSDLATIRSGAALGATAVQPAAISDMETQTHASATFATKTALATLSDTVDSKLGKSDVIKQSDVDDSTPYGKAADAKDLNEKLSGKADKTSSRMLTSGVIGTNITWGTGLMSTKWGVTHSLNALHAVNAVDAEHAERMRVRFTGPTKVMQFEDEEITSTNLSVIVHSEISGISEKVAFLSDIDHTSVRFSNEVLAVGLNIDTNSVAQINAILNDLGGVPIEGTATTVGGLLLALAAAVAWLKKHALRKGIDSGGVPVDPNVSAFFTIDNTANNLDNIRTSAADATTAKNYIGGLIRYSHATYTSGKLTDRAVNAFTMTGNVTVQFPDAVTGKARDFLLLVTHTSGELTLPTGNTYYGDAPTMDAGATYLIALTEVSAGVWYMRTIKMEVPNG